MPKESKQSINKSSIFKVQYYLENDVLFYVYYRLFNLPNPLDLELANFLVRFVAWLRKVLLIAKCTFGFTLEKSHIIVHTVMTLSHKLEIEISTLKPSVCKIPIVFNDSRC